MDKDGDQRVLSAYIRNRYYVPTKAEYDSCRGHDYHGGGQAWCSWVGDYSPLRKNSYFKDLVATGEEDYTFRRRPIVIQQALQDAHWKTIVYRVDQSELVGARFDNVTRIKIYISAVALLSETVELDRFGVPWNILIPEMLPVLRVLCPNVKKVDTPHMLRGGVPSELKQIPYQ